MVFPVINFSPVGNNVRAGNAPQLFSLATTMDLTDFTPEDLDILKGHVKRGDWMDTAEDVANNADDHLINFVLGDGSSPCAFLGSVNAGGTGYAVNDIVTVVYVGATMIYETNFFVKDESGGVVTELILHDPGLWDPENPPDGYTALATTTNGGGSGLTIDITPSKLAGIGSTKGQSGLFGPVIINRTPLFQAV